MLHPRTTVAGLGTAILLLATLALTGCGPDDDTATSRGDSATNDRSVETAASRTETGSTDDAAAGDDADAPPADDAMRAVAPTTDKWGRNERGVIPAPANFKPKVTTGPSIEFDTLMYDFGRIWDTGEEYGQFHFQNVGSSTLRIYTVKPGCGCTTTTLEVFEYAPGEGNVIEVAFRPQGKNQQTKGITVISNARDTPEVKLRITAFLTELVKVEPRYSRIAAVIQGEARRTSFTFSCPADPTMTVASVKTAGMHADSITARLLTEGETRLDELGEEHVVGPGEHAVEITVKPDASWGALYGQVDVTCNVTLPKTGERIEHVASCNIATSVWGTLQADANMMRTPITTPGQRIKSQIEISSRSGEPFRILDARIEGARPTNLEITYEPAPGSNGSSYIVRIDTDSGRFIGTVAGTAVIFTDVPGEEQLRFRVAGVVRHPVQRN